jgi:rare lipoprotein A
MFTTTKWLLPAAALAMVSGTAEARPLLLSDLPPELWSLPSAQANLPDAQQAPVSGTASWYGHSHAGRRMSNGVRFDPQALTAAHATIPLGTKVKVVREDTGASVVVTITDRIGTCSRVLDLSQGAAAQLDMLQVGLAPVHLVSVTGAALNLLPAAPADASRCARRTTQRTARTTTSHKAAHVAAAKATHATVHRVSHVATMPVTHRAGQTAQRT